MQDQLGLQEASVIQEILTIMMAAANLITQLCCPNPNPLIRWAVTTRASLVGICVDLARGLP